MTDRAFSDDMTSGERPMPWPAMRPKLRSDALWVPTDDGVFLLCNASSLTIRGKHVAAWMDKLAPKLDGNITVAELTAGLPATHARMLENLVGTLLRDGLVRDAAEDEPHGLTDHELEVFAPEIAFIEYFRASPAARFERFRGAHITCTGSGLTFAGLVRALLLLGLRTVHAQPTTECHTDADSWRDLLPITRERDPLQQVAENPACGDGELAGRLDPAEIVIHVSDLPMPARARELADWAAGTGSTLLEAVIVGDEAWLGPFGTPLRPARWADAWARIGGGRAASARRPSEFLAVPTARIVASQLAFEAFRILTGIPADDFRNRLVCVDLATMQTSEHYLPPTDGVTGVLEAAGGLPSRLRPGEEERSAFSHAARRLVDDRSGIITALGEDDIPQLPLHAAVARVAVAAAGPYAGPVHGAGLTLAAAREAAARRALELHVLLDAAAAARADAAAGQAGDAGPAVFRGLDLTEDTPRAVPVGAIVPESGPVHRDDYLLGSGPTWTAALWRAVAEFVRTRLGADQRDLPTTEIGSAAVNATAVRCLRILEASDRKVRLRLVDSVPEGAVVISELDGEQAGAELGGTLEEAMTAALLAAVCRLHADLADAPVWRRPAARPARPGPGRPGVSLLEWLAAGSTPLIALRLDVRAEVAAALPAILCLYALPEPEAAG
jgi:hypothetical protein